MVKILADDPSSGSPPGCHRTGSGHGDPGDLEALEAFNTPEICGRSGRNLEEMRRKKTRPSFDKKINVMTMSSDQNARRRTKIELVERLLFIELIFCEKQILGSI